jgi:hypothetical protein
LTLSREFFDVLILIVIAVGLVAAGLRLRADFRRPLPPPYEPFDDREDTQPNKPIS